MGFLSPPYESVCRTWTEPGETRVCIFVKLTQKPNRHFHTKELLCETVRRSGPLFCKVCLSC